MERNVSKIYIMPNMKEFVPLLGEIGNLMLPKNDLMPKIREFRRSDWEWEMTILMREIQSRPVDFSLQALQ